MSERTTAAESGAELSERAEASIDAWEKKRAEEIGGSAQREDLSDDAESGGP